MDSRQKTHYEILGVKKDATSKEIVKAYRQLCKVWHPDRVPEEKKKEAEEQFKTILSAFETLRDEETRFAYDQELAGPNQSRQRQEFQFRRNPHQPQATFKKKFEFLVGDVVRFRQDISFMYYGDTGYNKRDIATIRKLEDRRVIIDYPFSPGIYALHEELELAGPSAWIVQKKVFVNPSTRRERVGQTLKPGYRVLATDMEGDRVRIMKVEFNGKSVNLVGWVSICSEDGNVTLLKRDKSKSMHNVNSKLRSERCFECKNGHELRESWTGGNRRCDVCKRLSSHTFTCFECDYDVCFVCRCDAKWDSASGPIDTEQLYAHLNNRNSVSQGTAETRV